jgi:HK97 family phage major capsid protein
MPKSARSLVSEYQAIYAAADEEGRDLTPSERDRVADLVDAATRQKAIDEKLKAFGGPASGENFTGGPGDVFVNSDGYKAVRASDMRPQQWSSGPVEVMGSPMQAKGTLTTTGGGAGPGGGLVPPYWEPGVVSKLLEPLGVGDLFGQSNVTTSQVRYVVEGTATNSAGGVAEAAAKPESTLGYTETIEPIKKIATVLPVSDEMLEDAPSIQAYLNQRLTLFVRVEEERQLLRGTGTNELVGLMHASRAINTYTKLAADDNATGLAKVIANTASSAFVEPTAIIMHPTNWLNTRLLRDGTGGTAGQFFGGGPFSGAYGNPGQTGMFGASLWNLPVVLSNTVGPGTALVGAFNTAAHIWRRGGVSVEATNSHSDLFVKNITMIRSESRLGLGVYRPTAFTEVRGLA